MKAILSYTLLLSFCLMLSEPCQAKSINICINNQSSVESITIAAITLALNDQITHDFQQFYLRDRKITVSVTSSPGCWPVKIVNGPLYFVGERVNGYHAYKKTPYAVVTVDVHDVSFSTVVSKQVLGMLVNPGAAGIEPYNPVARLFYFEPPGVQVGDFNIPRRYGATNWCGLRQNVGLCH